MRLLDDDALERIYQRLVREALFSGARSSTAPRVILIGGQPGAGKSHPVQAAQQELDAAGAGCALINGDELRSYHPHYEALVRVDSATAADKTGGDIGWWVRRGIAEAIAGRYSTVLETTMRQPAVVTRTADQFVDHGYQAELRVLLVHPEVSILGVYQRYAKALASTSILPRFTLKQYHDAALSQMPLTLAAVAPSLHAVRILNRRGEVLYASGSSPLEPAAAFEALRQTPLTAERVERIRRSWDELLTVLDRDTVPDVVRAGVRFEKQRFESLYTAAPTSPAPASPAPTPPAQRRPPRP